MKQIAQPTRRVNTVDEADLRKRGVLYDDEDGKPGIRGRSDAAL